MNLFHLMHVNNYLLVEVYLYHCCTFDFGNFDFRIFGSFDFDNFDFRIFDNFDFGNFDLGFDMFFGNFDFDSFDFDIVD